jgi:hypothetical protein
MTDATKRLLDLLAVIPDGEKVAAFFAEDGVMELPYLYALTKFPAATSHCLPKHAWRSCSDSQLIQKNVTSSI